MQSTILGQDLEVQGGPVRRQSCNASQLVLLCINHWISLMLGFNTDVSNTTYTLNS